MERNRVEVTQTTLRIIMKIVVFILVICLFFLGCEQHFTGSVEVVNEDGKLKSLSVKFPSDTMINKKEDAEKLIQVLESFIETIQAAKERALEENSL